MTKKGINSKTTIKKKRTYKKRTKKVSSKVLKPVVINDKVAEPVIPDVIVPDDSMMDKISQEFSETIPDDSTIPDVIIPDTSVSNISNNDSEPNIKDSQSEEINNDDMIPVQPEKPIKSEPASLADFEFPSIDDKPLESPKEYDTSSDLDKSVSKNVKKHKEVNIISLIIILLFFILILFIISSIYSQKFATAKIISSIKNELKVTDSETMSFKADITTTDNSNYDVLNNSEISGNYVSGKNLFKTSLKFTSDGQIIDGSIYNDGSNTYFYDKDLYDEMIYSETGKVDLSINSLKQNMISLIEQLGNSSITNYTRGYTEDGNKIIALKITNENIETITNIISDIKLDGIYQTYLDNLLTDIKTNPDSYIDTNIKLYSKLLSGKFIKLEIKNDALLTVAKTDDGYYIENIAKDSTITKINISNTNINLIEMKGSKTNLTINIDIDYTVNTTDEDTTTDNSSTAIDINSLDEQAQFKIKKVLNSDTIRADLMSLYYYVTDSLNELDMNVTDGNYLIYYKVPDKYNASNYNGKTEKKYINVDTMISYSIKDYQQYQVANYISDQYNKEISSTFYYDVKKSYTQQIEGNGMLFNYQIITKTYDSNYADYDTTSSTIYIWHQLDDNKVFMIEYEFQGQDITDESIKQLLDIQIGN